MPTYCYRCHDCRKTFEVRHGMFFENQRCVFCKSEDVFRLPQGQLKKTAEPTTKRPGKVVDKYIEDAKEEIKQEKKKLRAEEL